ncbi:hypothetical protein [Paraburkholderia bryophila]|uniref:Uncharacterized protein n=1 Tax=Paraburkholderia bryophila TaxID=420952 RepID=A0A329BQH5_9BURK|nr:hypothetical protein [Paraburkholderia bryophila]RAS21234.1 hypothetical protein BX591_13063 [Paraburkholderia bryophila]
MIYIGFVLQASLLGICTWNFFDDRMGRTPLRVASVGLLLCVAGIGLGASIANFEGIGLFSNEHSQLELVSQLINVGITAAGGNVLASGLVLRADLANQRAILDARQRLQDARVTIAELLRDHKHLALEESFNSPESISKRSSAIWNLIENATDDYRDANELLRKVGLEESARPYPQRKRNPSGRRI